MASQDMSGSRFVVDLGDIKLPPALEKRVEAEIQASVLRALAENSLGASQRGQKGRIPTIWDIPDFWDKFPGGLAGLWIGDQYKPPTILRSSSSGGLHTLTVQDHTLIMDAVMAHPLEVFRNLPKRYKSRAGGSPSATEMLEAALQVEQIDDYTKSRMQIVLEVLPQFEEAQASAPVSVKRSLDDLRDQLAGKSIEEQRRLFRDSGLRSRYRDDGIAEGMEIAARMLEDGAASIYSLNHRFYELLQSGQGPSSAHAAARDALSDIGSADTVGATAGGAAGALVTSPTGPGAAGGATAGAIIGGTGASLFTLGYHIGSWLGGLFD